MSADSITGLGTSLVSGADHALGREIVRALCQRGVPVRAFGAGGGAPDDAETDAGGGVEWLNGSVRDGTALRRACKDVATVFHCERVSRAGDASDAADADLLVGAARAAGAARIVHASGQGVGLDENAIRSEATVRAAADEGLATCAVRAGEIWDGDRGGLLDQLLELTARGWYVAKPPESELRCELTSVDLLARAMIAAADGLARQELAAGAVFTVTDGPPADPLERFEPVLIRLGFEPPRRRLGTFWLIAWAKLWRGLHRLHLATAPPVDPGFWHRLTRSRLEDPGTVAAARLALGVPSDVEGAGERAREKRRAEQTLEELAAARRARIERSWSLPFFVRLPNLRRTLAVITRLHRYFYLATAGRIGHVMGATTFLLIDNVGRRSGRTYRTPLLYVADGSRFVVAASNAGDARPPAWWLNLEAAPVTRVNVGNRRVRVRARVADADEAARLWPRMISSYRWFSGYRERSGREIPLVLLEPVDPEPSTRTHFDLPECVDFNTEAL